MLSQMDFQVILCDVNYFFQFHFLLRSLTTSIPPYRLSSFPHLLTDGAVAALSPPVQLVRLAQQRVERLASAVDGGWVGGHWKGGHVAHLLERIVALGGLIKQLVVLQVLWQPLQHGSGLVEVHLQKAVSCGLMLEVCIFESGTFRECWELIMCNVIQAIMF